MARRYAVEPPSNPFKTLTLDLNGTTLSHGDEFTVRGEGRFSFRYGWKNTQVTCWGPIGATSSMRTFDASRITTIHRTRKAQS